MAAALTPAKIYAQLEALVLPTLTCYKTDLTREDRNSLKAYTGPFLLSYRATGTNLLVLGEPKEFLIAGDPRPASEQVKHTYDRKRAEISCERQEFFLHFTGTEFKSLTRAEALAVVDAALPVTLAALAQQRAVTV